MTAPEPPGSGDAPASPGPATSADGAAAPSEPTQRDQATPVAPPATGEHPRAADGTPAPPETAQPVQPAPSAQGDRRDQGSQGDQGNRGDRGDQGDQGDQGEPSAQGNRRDQGDRGDQGGQTSGGRDRAPAVDGSDATTPTGFPAPYDDGLSPAVGGNGRAQDFQTWPIGEDVLAGPPPPPVEPVERTRFTRPRDLLIGLGLVVAVVAASVVAWQASDIRATAATPLVGPELTSPAPPDFFPPSLGEAWRAESPATPEPVATGPVVVTGDGGEVSGRDPQTGDVLWSYRRDLPLCTVTGAWERAVAVYRTDGELLPGHDPRGAGGCSEVTALASTDGTRAAQRNWDAEAGAELIDDGTYLTASGTELITTLRSDLVETMEYGQVPAPVVPERQPRTGCAYDSVFMNAGRIAVVERCPEDVADRLTVYKATGKDADRPEVLTSIVLGSEDGRVVAMTDRYTAVALPGPARLVVYGDDGSQVSSTPLAVPDADLRVSDAVADTVTATGAYYWFSGSQTIALSMEDLTPLWTVKDTLGPGVVFAGRMLVPVADGLAVLDQVDGSLVGTLAVDRGAHTGVVVLAAIGPMVLEQRGNTLVALR
ncbi:Rv3212 family protein [Actinokineospora sp. 24-640]